MPLEQEHRDGWCGEVLLVLDPSTDGAAGTTGTTGTAGSDGNDRIDGDDWINRSDRIDM
jgi:hypothetical protein